MHWLFCSHFKVDLVAGLGRGLEHERKQCARPLEVALPDLVSGTTRKCGVQQLRHLGPLLQPLGEPLPHLHGHDLGGQHLAGEEVVLDEATQRGADTILAPRYDRGVGGWGSPGDIGRER